MSKMVWQPTSPEKSRMGQFLTFVEKRFQLKFQEYQDLHQWSIDNMADFWSTLADFFGITFDEPAETVLNSYQHMFDARWFESARFNYAQQLLKRNDSHPALVSIKENNERIVITYQQLRKLVAQCAKGLQQAGVKTGDRVAAIMPNVPETIIALLACSAIGAIWSSCSPDFGAQAAIDRLGQIEPTVLIATTGHQYFAKQHDAFEKIQTVSAAMPSLKKLVICPNIKSDKDWMGLPNAQFWDDFLQEDAEETFVSLAFNHPLYILFSSGTTGKPKCIMHGAGGTLLQHIKELGLHSDLNEDSNLCFYTTCGWMMWNWMVSVLALGATLTLYEGSPTYPDPFRLFKIIEEEKVTAFGTSAKFISAIEKTNAKPNQRFPMSCLKRIFSTGSPLLPANYDFVYQHIKSDVQLCSISGGTDIVSCFALGNPLLPVYRGELQCLGLGMAVAVFNEEGESVQQERGELVCTKPFPSMPIGFWHDTDSSLYHKAYFERFPEIWAHGDFAEKTPHNGLIIYGRSDAVLNPGGVRIGTAEIYRQIEKIPAVLDSVVIGQDWQEDVRVVLFVKLREGIKLNDDLERNIKDTIRTNASPRHVPAKILQVMDIPITMSGKTVELAVKQVVHGLPVNNLQSLANPEALEQFRNRKELA